jgi:hypothetical protein
MDNSNPLPEWTIMLYMNVEPEGFETSFKKNLQEICSVGSTAMVKIIIVADRNPNKEGRLSKNFLPTIYEITERRKSNAKKKFKKKLSIEEIGSPVALEEFLDFCKSHYTAEKYMLIFWDHGAGTAVSASPDPGSKTGGLQDSLYAKEIFTAIKNTFKQIDLIAFDACWMQMLENTYALRRCAKYMVASQNLASIEGFGYFMFLKYLTAHPLSSPLEAAILLIKSCYLKVSDPVKARPGEDIVELLYQNIYDDETITLSCIKLDEVSDFAGLVDDLAEAFLKHKKFLFPYIRIARFLCLSYFDEESPPNFNLKTIDLIYFLKKMLDTKFETDQEERSFEPIAKIIYNIVEYAEMRLIAYKEIGTSMQEEHATEKRWGAHGFSIFFPEHVFEWQMYKDKEGWYYEKDPKIQVPFAEENKWRSFLNTYFRYVKSVIKDEW